MNSGAARQSIRPSQAVQSTLMCPIAAKDNRGNGFLSERCPMPHDGLRVFIFERESLIAKTMKFLLAGAVLAGTMTVTVPASAQRLSFGPDGPGIDLRSRNQRMHDREWARRDREDGYYRRQRYRDRDRVYRRDYDY